MKTRKIRYRGDQKDHSLLIGNHGDVDFKTSGKFNISGLIYCPRYTVTISLSGNGAVSLRGACRTIIVQQIKGDCILDVSEVSCQEFQCLSAQGSSQIDIGKTRLISKAHLEEQAVLSYTGRPFISKYSIKGSGKLQRKIKKAA